MNIKKYIIGAAVLATVAGAAASLVLAQDMAGQANSSTALTATAHARPMVVEIGPGGKTLLRGTVSAVASNSLTVKSWGGNWVVNIITTTRLAPDSVTSTSHFQVGDFVGVQGVVNQNADWTIDATLVRSWTEKKATATQNRDNEKKDETTKLPGLKVNEESKGVQQQIQSILEQIRKIQEQINSQKDQ